MFPSHTALHPGSVPFPDSAFWLLHLSLLGFPNVHLCTLRPLLTRGQALFSSLIKTPLALSTSCRGPISSNKPSLSCTPWSDDLVSRAHGEAETVLLLMPPPPPPRALGPPVHGRADWVLRPASFLSRTPRSQMMDPRVSLAHRLFPSCRLHSPLRRLSRSRPGPWAAGRELRCLSSGLHSPQPRGGDGKA